MKTKTKQRKLAAPLSPETAARRTAVINAKRAWGSHDATVEQGLKRIAAVRAEEDRLVEMVNSHWLLQREHEATVGRDPTFAGAIAPGRRRDVVLELQRHRPSLLEHPPLTMPVITPPVPTPEAVAAAERARLREDANAKQFNRGAYRGVSSI